MQNNTILELKNVKKYFPIKHGLFYKTVGFVKAVDGISIKLDEGKTLGIVGESGSGKSTLARVIIGLYRIDGGKIIFRGNDIDSLDKKDMFFIKNNVQMVFQDPYSSLDPRFTVEKIIAEPIENFNRQIKRKAVRQRIFELLSIVGLKNEIIKRFPHEFSGGERQRIAIARSLSINPSLLILDEPVSALDVTIQAQILKILSGLQKKLGLSYLFISHDLRAVKRISDNIAVMYLGKIMEFAPKERIFKNPAHPYTRALIAARYGKIEIKGDATSDTPTACRFNLRCPYAKDICYKAEPHLEEKSKEQYAACHFPLL